MSSRTLLRTIAAAGRPAATIPRRGLATSPQLAHKETSYNDESHDVHRHKDDLINKHKLGKAHWKAELASNSEEAVKADRDAAREAAAGVGGPEQTKDHLQRLQERTKHHAEKTSKAGTSDGDDL